MEHVRQHVRPSTYAGYESNIRLHLAPGIGRKMLTRLSVRDVRLMVDDLRASGLNPRSIQYAHARIRSALEHAQREELVSRNVAKLVRVEQPTTLRPSEPLTVEEARKLLDLVRGHRLDALWVVLLILGLRRGEACGPRWEHVDFEARTLRIAQSVQQVDGKLRELPTKSRRSNRTVPLPPHCIYALADRHAALQREHGQPGRPWQPTGQLSTTPRSVPRGCTTPGTRRPTMLLVLGGSQRAVMDVMGWSHTSMTLRYQHLAGEIRQDIATQLGGLLWEEK